MVENLGFADGSNILICVWEDWGDRDVSGLQVADPLSDHPSKLMLMGWGGLPNKVAWQMSDPLLDPLSRFPSREGWSSILCASGYAHEDDSLGPPSPEGWQFFQPWQQMASNVMDGQPKHFSHTRPHL